MIWAASGVGAEGVQNLGLDDITSLHFIMASWNIFLTAPEMFVR
jgi:hypothetical protein